MQEQPYISEKRKFQVEEGILIFLLILSLTGIAITDFSPDDGYGYWIIMVFVYSKRNWRRRGTLGLRYLKKLMR